MRVLLYDKYGVLVISTRSVMVASECRTLVPLSPLRERRTTVSQYGHVPRGIKHSAAKRHRRGSFDKQR